MPHILTFDAVAPTDPATARTPPGDSFPSLSSTLLALAATTFVPLPSYAGALPRGARLEIAASVDSDDVEPSDDKDFDATDTQFTLSWDFSSLGTACDEGGCVVNVLTGSNCADVMQCTVHTDDRCCASGSNCDGDLQTWCQVRSCGTCEEPSCQTLHSSNELRGQAQVEMGIGLSGLVGRAVTLGLSESSQPIACALLGPNESLPTYAIVSMGADVHDNVAPDGTRLMASDFEPYLTYIGPLAVTGTVGPITTEGTVQTFDFALEGVDQDCASGPSTEDNSCGIRIHEGRTCKAEAGGHYYDWFRTGPSAADPWASVVYETGNGSHTVETGYTAADLVGRTVIVYDKDGDRVACATLGVMSSPNGRRLDEFPIDPILDDDCDGAVSSISCIRDKVAATVTFSEGPFASLYCTIRDMIISVQAVLSSLLDPMPAETSPCTEDPTFLCKNGNPISRVSISIPTPQGPVAINDHIGAYNWKVAAAEEAAALFSQEFGSTSACSCFFTPTGLMGCAWGIPFTTESLMGCAWGIPDSTASLMNCAWGIPYQVPTAACLWETLRPPAVQAPPTSPPSTPPYPPCDPDPQAVCLEVYQPVCGGDGVTYPNSCRALAACALDTTDGACLPPPPSPSTPAPPSFPPPLSPGDCICPSPSPLPAPASASGANNPSCGDPAGDFDEDGLFRLADAVFVAEVWSGVKNWMFD